MYLPEWGCPYGTLVSTEPTVSTNRNTGQLQTQSMQNGLKMKTERNGESEQLLTEIKAGDHISAKCSHFQQTQRPQTAKNIQKYFIFPPASHKTDRGAEGDI